MWNDMKMPTLSAAVRGIAVWNFARFISRVFRLETKEIVTDPVTLSNISKKFNSVILVLFSKLVSSTIKFIITKLNIGPQLWSRR